MIKSKRLLSLIAAVALLTGIGVQVFLPGKVFATQIYSRSLTLASDPTGSDIDSDGIIDGGTMPGATVDHNFDFGIDFNASSYNVGSITFQYCTTGEPVPGGIGCYAPPGLDVSSATAADLTGDGITGWTVEGTSKNVDAGDSAYTLKNQITLSVASAVGISAQTTIKEGLDKVVNPDNTNCYGGTAPQSNNCTFYVRISVFSSTDGSGVATDTGTVAASTNSPIYLSGTMPESLLFCTGQSITETNNVPDCSTATSDTVAFNQLFSPTSTSWATSQMAASTNAGSGYSITVNGPTLTSGGNTISAIGATAAAPAPGTSQFGLNTVLDTDANTAVPAPLPASANVTTPTGNSFYHGESVGQYAIGSSPGPDEYAFNSGDIVADSTSLASDPQVFTSTYMVNVPGHQPAGTYSTTLTYICTPTF